MKIKNQNFWNLASIRIFIILFVIISIIVLINKRIKANQFKKIEFINNELRKKNFEGTLLIQNDKISVIKCSKGCDISINILDINIEAVNIQDSNYYYILNSFKNSNNGYLYSLQSQSKIINNFGYKIKEIIKPNWYFVEHN